VIKPVQQLVLLLFILVINSCVSEFVPESAKKRNCLWLRINYRSAGNQYHKTVKIIATWHKSEARPLSGCMVRITDDMGNSYSLQENESGTYVTDSTEFKGEIGKFYTLHIGIKEGNIYMNYESTPMEMGPVPPVDSIYYEKR